MVNDRQRRYDGRLRCFTIVDHAGSREIIPTPLSEAVNYRMLDSYRALPQQSCQPTTSRNQLVLLSQLIAHAYDCLGKATPIVNTCTLLTLARRPAIESIG
jgi:hypothetical protein